ncbi:MAG: YbaK/EbsC family protein [Candidatus Bathyarchaeia archaeon]
MMSEGFQDLVAFLRKAGIWYRFLEKPETIHTQDAARVAGLELYRVTKNLVAIDSQGRYVLLVVPGDRRVDLKAAAKALGVEGVRLVPFEEAEGISGYPPGGTPTLGHKTKMIVLMDKSLLRFETLYCGGGSRTRLLELRTEDILRLTGAIIADISQT